MLCFVGAFTDVSAVGVVWRTDETVDSWGVGNVRACRDNGVVLCDGFFFILHRGARTECGSR